MLPIDFLAKMKSLLKDDYDKFLDSYNMPRYHSLRINTLKCSDNSFIENNNLTQVPWAKNGYYYNEELKPGKSPYHEAGVYYIQEPSAMSPATFLDARPGDTVLDLCAAPGGKSTQIACSLCEKGLLISNEIHPQRAKILSENIERMGIKNCIVTNESSDRLATRFPLFFDRIMVDAPCSGEGMFRKNNEACDEWSMENVTKCSERQSEILHNASLMLKPGGRIVYSTCTFSMEENENVISDFLNSHSDFYSPDIDAPSPIEKGFIKGTFRLWPHRLHGEGHFVAILERKADESVIKKDTPVKQSKKKGNKSSKALTEKDLPDYFDFKKKYIINPPIGIYMKFGDQLYIVPEYTPDLSGIKVLRPGLHLGTILKNRFEPSHSLALALKKEDFINTCNIESGDKTIYEYISGQTFQYDGDNGWYLILYDNYSIGFGKLSGGIMKNHNPKGLRKNLLQ